MTVKEQVREVLNHLPDDCTMEQVQERLQIITMLNEREALADQPGAIWHSHEEVRKYFEERSAQWRKQG